MDPVSTLAIKPMIDGIVSKIVIPKLEKLATRVGLEYNKLLVPKGEHFLNIFIERTKDIVLSILWY